MTWNEKNETKQCKKQKQNESFSFTNLFNSLLKNKRVGGNFPRKKKQKTNKNKNSFSHFRKMQ